MYVMSIVIEIGKLQSFHRAQEQSDVEKPLNRNVMSYMRKSAHAHNDKNTRKSSSTIKTQ